MEPKRSYLSTTMLRNLQSYLSTTVLGHLQSYLSTTMLGNLQSYFTTNLNILLKLLIKISRPVTIPEISNVTELMSLRNCELSDT